MGGKNERSNEKIQKIVFWVVWKIVWICTILWLKTRNCMVKVLFKSTKENRERKMIGKRMHDGGNFFGQEWRGDFFDANSTAEPESRIPNLEAGQMPCYHKTEQERSLCSTNRLQNKEPIPALQGRKQSLKEKSNVSKLKILLRWWIKSYSDGGFPTPILWPFLRE